LADQVLRKARSIREALCPRQPGFSLETVPISHDS
jgi:hypothetical protein